MIDYEFEKIVKENKRLINYHIRKLRINDSTGDFFAEGLVALWNAYSAYDPDQGSFSSYLNWKIRNSLIDKIRKEMKNREIERIYKQEQIHSLAYQVEDVIEDFYLWEQVKKVLTNNQWKWVHYYIIHDLSVDQIAKVEDVSRDAVKNWGRHARRKLNETFQNLGK